MRAGMALSPEWAMREEEVNSVAGVPRRPGFEAGPPEFLLASIRVRTGVRWIA
jgi:hypothetical protein